MLLELEVLDVLVVLVVLVVVAALAVPAVLAVLAAREAICMMDSLSVRMWLGVSWEIAGGSGAC